MSTYKWVSVLIFCCFLWKQVTSIYVEKVVVPPVVIAGSSVELKCFYKEEREALYSLKWWKGEDQFYQFIPPRRHFFPIHGVRVNMPATNNANKESPAGIESVILSNVGLDTTGAFRCEVMTENNFQTVFKEANMTVVYPPSGPPVITDQTRQLGRMSAGSRVSFMCAVPFSKPQALVRWRINGIEVSDSLWVNKHSPISSGVLTNLYTSLDFILPQSLANDPSGRLRVTCEAIQEQSLYEESDEAVLLLKRPYSSWLFGSGTVVLPSTIPLTLPILINLILLL